MNALSYRNTFTLGKCLYLKNEWMIPSKRNMSSIEELFNMKLTGKFSVNDASGADMYLSSEGVQQFAIEKF